MAHITPNDMLAETHRGMAEPGSASKVKADDRQQDLKHERSEDHALASDAASSDDDDRPSASEREELKDRLFEDDDRGGRASDGLSSGDRPSSSGSERS
jgi:hypothetical protein